MASREECPCCQGKITVEKGPTFYTKEGLGKSRLANVASWSVEHRCPVHGIVGKSYHFKVLGYMP